MTTRHVLTAMSGLIAGMFVLLLSGTIVSTALPVIVADIGGSQSDYTWIVTANLLSMTISTPIWGKLADLVSKKLLIQLALGIFVVTTVIAGFATSASWLITFRFLQGIGVGGMMAVAQVVIADIVSPRERGKYMGIMGAVMAVAQIGGPLLGGVITDAVGWRWNFFLPVPIAVAAVILIQTTLHLTRIPHAQKPKVDYLGAALIAGGIGTLLVWLSLGGSEFAWDSITSIMFGAIAGVLIVAAAVWEIFFASAPIVPLRLFAQKTFALATIGSISVGITMFGAAVFLSQYLQLARGMTPTESGLATIPMVIGSLVTSMGVGFIISKTGRWKPFVIAAAVVLVIGLALMGTLHFDTPIALVWLYMFLLGVGTGGLMQNLLLVAQNSLPPRQMGAGTGSVNFFRSLGGTVGVTVLGSLLAVSVKDRITSGLTDLIPTLQDPTCAAGLETIQAGQVPAMATLCDPLRLVIEGAYGESIAWLFVLVAPVALISLLCVVLLPNTPLSRKTAVQQIEEELGAQFSELEPITIESTEPTGGERERTPDAAGGARGADDSRGEDAT